MTKMHRLGTAADAANVLGISRSQLNEIRARCTLVYDPETRHTSSLPSADDLVKIYREEVGSVPDGGGQRRDPVVEHYLRSRYLVCPSLFAYKLPGGRWCYRLDDLQRLKEQGPPGAS